MWGDLGWRLSFAVFGGVMILAPLLQAYFFGIKNLALIANILIFPLVPLAMLLTFIAGIGALTLPTFAAIVGMPAYWSLHYMTTVVMYVANLRWAQSTVTINGWWLLYIMRFW